MKPRTLRPASFRPRLPSGGEGFDSLACPAQSLLHQFATRGIVDGTEVECPDDPFDEDLGIGPTIRRHIRRIAQGGEPVLKRLQLGEDCFPLGLGEWPGG